jgi:hypothetical protein
MTKANMSATFEQRNPMPEHNIVSREEWIMARKELLAKEQAPPDEFAVANKIYWPKTASQAILVSTAVESSYATDEGEISCALVVQHQDFHHRIHLNKRERHDNGRQGN